MEFVILMNLMTVFKTVTEFGEDLRNMIVVEFVAVMLLYAVRMDL